MDNEWNFFVTLLTALSKQWLCHQEIKKTLTTCFVKASALNFSMTRKGDKKFKCHADGDLFFDTRVENNGTVSN
jgi:hypothetical protein